MSASREKKQRQGAGLDPKATKAQQEQAERKRKTVLYSVIGGIVVVLVAALLIWNSNFFQRRATAATVGDEKLSASDLSYYYYSARNSYYNTYYYYYSYLGYSMPGDDDVMDESTGQTYREYYMETALNNAATYTALYNEAVANGYSLSDVKDDLDAQLDSLKAQAASSGYSYGAYLRAMYGNYITASTVERLIGRELLASLYYSDHGDELAETYTQEQLEAYYDENADSLDTFEYSYLLINAEDVEDTDEDGNKLDEDTVAKLEEQAMADAKVKADEALAKYEEGVSVADLIEEYEPASSADHTTSVGSAISFSAVYYDKLMGMKDGDSAVVEATSGYYLVALHSRTLVEDPTRDVRHILIRTETTTDDEGKVVAPTDEAWAAAEEKAQSILDEYKNGEQTEDAFAALANQYSDDAGSNTTGGLYSKVANTDSYYVTEFLDWIFADGRQPGDVSDPVRHEGDTSSSSAYWGYHLIYLVDDNEPVWARTARNTLVSTDLAEWSEGLAAGYPTALTSAADAIGK